MTDVSDHALAELHAFACTLRSVMLASPDTLHSVTGELIRRRANAESARQLCIAAQKTINAFDMFRDGHNSENHVGEAIEVLATALRKALGLNIDLDPE